MLPRRASGCVGCRRRENIRITGFSRSRRNLKPLKDIVHEACLKGFSLERAVIQPAWKALKVREAKGHFTLKASESL